MSSTFSAKRLAALKKCEVIKVVEYLQAENAQLKRELKEAKQDDDKACHSRV
jgi:hypothetical protein